ncbi:unnamed protein product [Penicillium olsonii]|uniref:Pentatricopeptide repeat protein n=1 Tax=Penicillium olsonii TaxID=99116 RepID=A0A9W4MQY6_PENOL|nr:unnamed protein product [Penicillium olsonii]CAG8080092.1 unnamed protein product [Penicillium olsonii]
MTLRLPGSLVNRALRSRLLSAQQCRAATAARNLPVTQNLFNATRAASSLSAYSSENHRPQFPSHGDRFDNQAQGQVQRKRSNNRMPKNTLNPAKRELLMAVASNNRSARYDNEKEIAESEALDTAAAQDYGAVEGQEKREPSEDEETPETETPGQENFNINNQRKVPREFQIAPSIVNMELKWLMGDPQKIADRVRRMLRNDQPALAAAIVRAGTKQGLGTGVAWNHLIAYCMEQQHPQAAFKFYNDMKKRGRRPNTHLYTIMLKGFSSAQMSPSVVKTAASVYRSISAPNSGVELNIIHTNAMLTVCHRHGDMDRLWKIAGELPEEGEGAPDSTTYTVILNAVQFAARRDIEKMSPDQIDKILARKSQAIIEGKRVWADVIYRWKNQTLEVDNSLVNAMAGLLLDGASDFDCYNVMELYKQTMGIPILAKRPAESEKTTRRRITHEQNQAIETSELQRQEKMEDLPFVDENNNPLGEAEMAGEPAEVAEELEEESSEMEEQEEEEDESFDDLFKPVVPGSDEMSFLQPTSKELTLLLNACFTMTQGTDGALSYWKYMTMEENHHRIEPDAFTYVTYFRMLRISRSSKIAVKTLREQMVPSGHATGTAFHIALSVCRRDRRNHSVLLHANEVVGLMDKALILPDIRVLDGYLETIQIISGGHSVLLGLRGLESKGVGGKTRTLQDVGKKLQALLRLNAIATLRPYVAQLHEAIENGKPEENTRWSDAQNKLADPVNGSAAAKFMARVRLIVDDTLSVHYKNFVSKEERKILLAESKMLKKYSDQKVIASLKAKTVYPTAAQKEAAKERIANYQEACRLGQNGSEESTVAQTDSGSQREVKTQAEAEAKA